MSERLDQAAGFLDISQNSSSEVSFSNFVFVYKVRIDRFFWKLRNGLYKTSYIKGQFYYLSSVIRDSPSPIIFFLNF